jgi:hypothetical protein
MRLKTLIISLVFLLVGALPAYALDATKAQDVVLISMQAVTHPDTVVGTAISVADDFMVCGAFFYGPTETAATEEGAIFRLQYSVSASGNEDWVTFPGADFITFSGAATTCVIESTEAAGETAINVDDASVFDHGDVVYLDDATVADGEWNYVDIEDTTGEEYLTVVYGITNAKAANDDFWKANIFSWCVDVTAISRIRAYFSNNNVTTGSNADIKATAVKFTDIEG